MAASTPLSPAVGPSTAAEMVVSDIRREWDWVKVGVEEVCRANRNLTYRPEDVYAACVNRQAVLWTCPDGFIITTTLTDEFTGEKTLFLWLAWAKSRGTSLLTKYQGFLERATKEAGYSILETRSPFLGLMSHMEAHGWSVDTVIYTKRV